MNNRIDLEKMTNEQISKYIKNLRKDRNELQNRISELQKTINNLLKQVGEDNTLYPDTPSLPVIRLGISSYTNKITPYCEKHGAMNCYEHEIYRCTICGVAVDMTKFRELVGKNV